MIGDVDFQITPPWKIVHEIARTGAIVLRNFFHRDEIEEFGWWARSEHDRTGAMHIQDNRLFRRRMHKRLFNHWHYAVLREAFDNRWRPASATGTRWIKPRGVGGHGPLGPHCDWWVHGEALFRINFWCPFQHCGDDRPGLAVVNSGDGRVEGMFAGSNPKYDGDPKWQFARLSPEAWELASKHDPKAIARLESQFAGDILCPVLDPGDAILLTDRTLHWTHVRPGMKMDRGNVELRFERT